MSSDALNFSMQETYGSTDKLLIHYDFNTGVIASGVSAAQEGSYYWGYIPNGIPANNTGLWSGKILDSQNASAAGAINRVTGDFLSGHRARLDDSNIEVNTAGAAEIDYDNLSAVFDMEFTGQVNDVVLFGSLEKTSTTINSVTYTGSKGFNFGVTKRGHLFYQGFDSDGDFIHTFKSAELSRRNIIAFSHGENDIGLHKIDILNGRHDSEYVDRHHYPKLVNSDSFFIGGSKNWYENPNSTQDGSYKTSTPTSSVYINSFVLLSGQAAPSSLFSLASGMLGDYSVETIPRTTKERLTGYQEEIVYKTGITGYDYQGTGNIALATGKYMFTGRFFGGSSTNTGEGDRYFIYRSFDDALSASGVRTFVKEEVGYLHSGSGYQYLPTGEDAFATLGLQNVEGAVSEYIEQRGISGAATVAVKLYGSQFLTGVTSGISGIKQIPKYETTIEREAYDESGISILGNSSLFKKNFIYYLGERL